MLACAGTPFPQHDLGEDRATRACRRKPTVGKNRKLSIIVSTNLELESDGVWEQECVFGLALDQEALAEARRPRRWV